MLFNNPIKAKQKITNRLKKLGLTPTIVIAHSKKSFVAFDNIHMYYLRDGRVHYSDINKQVFFSYFQNEHHCLCSINSGLLCLNCTTEDYQVIKGHVIKLGAMWLDNRTVDEKNNIYKFIIKNNINSNALSYAFVDKENNIIGFRDGKLLTNAIPLKQNIVSKMGFFIRGNLVGTINSSQEADYISGYDIKKFGILLKNKDADKIQEIENVIQNIYHAEIIKKMLPVTLASEYSNINAYNRLLGSDFETPVSTLIPNHDIIYNTKASPTKVSFVNDSNRKKFTIGNCSVSAYGDLDLLFENCNHDEFDALSDYSSSLRFKYLTIDDCKHAKNTILNSFMENKVANKVKSREQSFRKVENDSGKSNDIKILIDTEYFQSRPSLNELGLKKYNTMYLVDKLKHIKFKYDLHDDTYILYDFKEHFAKHDDETLFEDGIPRTAIYYDLKLYNSKSQKIKITIAAPTGTNRNFDTRKKLNKIYLREGFIPRNGKSINNIPVKQLKQLKELFSDGIITEDEFKAKKKQLLGL